MRDMLVLVDESETSSEMMICHDDQLIRRARAARHGVGKGTRTSQSHTRRPIAAEN